MAAIPTCLTGSEVSQYLIDKGFEPFTRGKVKEFFAIPGRPDLLLQLFTDRVSIFGFVLPALVPHKGEVSTALTRFWMMRVKDIMGNPLVSSEKWPWQNAAVDLRRERLDELPLERCLVVRKLKIWPYKMIFRHHLGGSVYEEYQRTGKVAGRQLPLGLSKWAYLRKPIFTPATKTQSGYDINITVDDFKKETGRKGTQVVRDLRELYHWAYGFARQRGICIFDTEFEIGVLQGEEKKGRKAPPILADELFTPDSSRFADEADWYQVMKENRDPAFLDKQIVRDWGLKFETPWGRGVNLLDPANPDHLKFVSQLEVPQEVIDLTTDRYLKIFSRLTGMTLDAYQHSYLLFTKRMPTYPEPSVVQAPP